MSRACKSVALAGGPGAMDGTDLGSAQRPMVHTQLVDFSSEVDIVVGYIPVGVVAAQPERGGNIEVDQGHVPAALFLLFHPIDVNPIAPRRKALDHARYMVPAAICNLDGLGNQV